jgi:hypothetical protein
MHRLHRYFDFFFFVLPLPALSVGFLSPLPFFHYFFFASGFWVAFGFVDCTLCTSDIWVGGTTRLVVWLAAFCYIDNCCNCFDSCSVGFIFVEPTIPSHVVHISIWSCQVLTVVHLENFRKVNQTKSKSSLVVELSLLHILLKTLPTLRRLSITGVPNT